MVTIFGRVDQAKPVWHGYDVEDNSGPEACLQMGRSFVPKARSLLLPRRPQPMAPTNSTSCRTENTPLFRSFLLVSISIAGNFEKRYQTNLSAGQCGNIRFKFEPTTRIRGRLIFPPGMKPKNLEVDVVPTHLENVDQFAGASIFTDEHHRFDFWPLLSCDYYVGVNIKNLSKEGELFPQTYYPGATDKRNAIMVHLTEGEVKDVEIPLPTLGDPVE